MTSSRKNAQKQIEELRKNLELIEVRKSEYVQATDIPLQLIKTEEETRAKLADLESVLRAPEIDAQSNRTHSRWLLAAGIGVALVGAFIGIWFWTNGGSRTPIDTSASSPPHVTASPDPGATAAPTARDTPGTATSTTAEPISFPPLPDVAPPLTTTVLLLSSPPCATEQIDLETFLAGATNTKTPPVVLESKNMTYGLAEDRPAVRSTGETSGADLVIWCTVEGTGIEIHFEMLTQRATPEVYEPHTLSMPVQPVDRSQRAALGVINYSRRDYLGAAPVLRTAVDMSSEGDEAAILTLLIGNAQIFSHAYETATTTYDQVVAAQPGWPFAWHNLGVAQLYAAWRSHDFDKALAAFEEARTLDPGFELPLISIARIYRWIADEVPGSYEKAISACEQAERSQNTEVRAQGTVCMNLTQLVGWTQGFSTELPWYGDRKALEDATTRYWSEPLALIGTVQEAYWLVNQDQMARQQARAYFESYLREAYDDVHLEESSKMYRDIARSLQEDTVKPGS